MTRTGLSAVLILAAALAAPAPVAAGATYTWDGGLSHGNGVIPNTWSAVFNWQGGAAPVSNPSTTIVFTESGRWTISSQSIANPFLLNDMIFDPTSNVTALTGDALDFRFNVLFNPQLTQNSATDVTIGNPLVLSSPLGVVGTGTGGVTLNGSISGPGDLIMAAADTLTLGNATNTYTGGTFVYGGTLRLTSGTAIPTGGNVTVNSGGTFSTNGLSNTTATAIGTLAVNGTGTFRVPSGGGVSYHLNKLVMTGGIVEMTGTIPADLHFRNSGAGITTNASSVTATLTGGPLTRLQNDTGSPLPITVAAGTTPSGIDLDAGIALSAAGANPNFVITGGGFMRLSSLANTGNITLAGAGGLVANDLATNGVGVLGTGLVTLQGAGDNGGGLYYDGPTAVSTKGLTLAARSTINVVVPDTNLRLNGVIGETPAASGIGLIVTGPNPATYVGQTSTLTLGGANTYTGFTEVKYQAVLAVPTVTNAGQPGPLGAFPTTAAYGLTLKDGGFTLTGTDPNYSTNRGMVINHSGYVTVANAATNLTISGQVLADGGSAGLVKTGPGTLTLTNPTNNITGIFVKAGRLVVGGAAGNGVIPAGAVAQVDSGAELFVAAPEADDNGASALAGVDLTGGILRLSAAAVRYSMDELGMFAGSTVALTDTASGPLFLNFYHPGASVNVHGNSTWSGSGAYVANASGAELPITIDPGVTLTSSVGLYSAYNSMAGKFGTFRVTGGGTLDLSPAAHCLAQVTVNRAKLRMVEGSALDDAIIFSSGLTLDAGTLAYAGGTLTQPGYLYLGPGGGTLDVENPDTTLTYTGYVYDRGSLLTKAGPGVLILNNLYNQYGGGLAVSGGRLDVVDEALLGAADVTVNPAGTLRYTASVTTARTFNLTGGTIETPAGVTVTLSGAAVNGGFLRGAFALSGSASISGTTTLNGTTINQTGPAALNNFTNGGKLTNMTGQTLAWNGGVNAASGNFIVNGSANVSNWSSNGVTTVSAGGALNDSAADLVLGGGSRTTVNLSATLATEADTTIELNGGLLVNNGTIVGTTNVNFGSLAKGAGIYGVVNVNQGSIFAPGNSLGIVTAAEVHFDNTAGSGVPILQIELAGTTPGTQYDQLHVTGQLSLGGTLAVSLLNSFAPQIGNSFDILDWNSLSGVFSSIALPSLDGGFVWNTSQLYTTGVLSVQSAGLAGDFNHNGTVDAADYVVWRKGLGTTYTQTDYDVWRTHFGQSAGSGAAVNDFAVPEPPGLVLLALGGLALVASRTSWPKTWTGPLRLGLCSSPVQSWKMRSPCRTPTKSQKLSTKCRTPRRGVGKVAGIVSGCVCRIILH